MSADSLVVELTGSVSRLRQSFEQHTEDDKKNFKYSHHMLEDLISKHSEERIKNMADSVVFRETLASVNTRLHTIERLAWTLLIGLLGIVGTQLMKLLG